MISLLEERYRRALRMLPRSYREQWADDMVATFMERAYRSLPDDREGVELSSPRWAELASIAGLAVRLRLGAEPAYAAWGEAVRRIALIGLLAHTVFALTGVLLTVWSFEGLPGVPQPGEGFTSWWQAMGSMSGLLWLPAFLAVLSGHRRAARILALVAYAPSLAAVLVGLQADRGANPAWQLGWVLFDALPIVALAAFHQGAPPVRQRPWLIALPVGMVLLAGTEVVMLQLPDRYTVFSVVAGGSGLWCIGVTVAGVISVVGAVRLPGRASTWPLTLALLAPAVLVLHALMLLDYIGFDAPAPEYVSPGLAGLAQCSALLLVGVVLAVVARRRLRSTGGYLDTGPVSG